MNLLYNYLGSALPIIVSAALLAISFLFFRKLFRFLLALALLLSLGSFIFFCFNSPGTYGEKMKAALYRMKSTALRTAESGKGLFNKPSEDRYQEEARKVLQDEEKTKQLIEKHIDDTFRKVEKGEE